MARVCDVRRRIAALGRKVFKDPLKPRAAAGAALAGLAFMTLLEGIHFGLAKPAKAAADEAPAVASASPAPAAAAKPEESAKPASSPSARPDVRPMRIRVTDVDGKPIAGAEVRASAVVRSSGVVRRSAANTAVLVYQANPEGIATIDVPREEVTYLRILARAEGHVTAGAPQWESDDGSDRAPSEFDFALEPGTVLGGVVRDEQGRPIAGVEVSLSGLGASPGVRRYITLDNKVRTDAEGKWVSRRVPQRLPGFYATIRFKHPDYASPPEWILGRQPVSPFREQTAVTVLAKGIAVEGTVTDFQGRPVAAAKVALFPDGLSDDCPRATTDSKGHYQLRPASPASTTSRRPPPTTRPRSAG